MVMSRGMREGDVDGDADGNVNVNVVRFGWLKRPCAMFEP